MDENGLSRFIDSNRFLMNCGLVPDSVKNNLFFYGSIVHKDVEAVELKLEVESKTVYYKIYISKRLLKQFNRFQELSHAQSLLGLWKFKLILKKEGNLNFSTLLNEFVKDFCGSKWHAEVEVIDSTLYEDGIINEEASGDDISNNK